MVYANENMLQDTLYVSGWALSNANNIRNQFVKFGYYYAKQLHL